MACNVLFTYGILVRFCPWLSLKPYLENHLIKAIPIIALHDDHVLIWFLHRMITRNTILFEFILLLYMRVCYLIVYSVLYLLEWDIPMSMCAMHILYAHWFSLVHMLNFVCYHVLISHFDLFWTTWMTSDVIGSINGYMFICQICISLDFGRLVHAYLLCVNLHALFTLFDPIYMVIP